MSSPQQKTEPVQQDTPEEPYSVFTKRQKWVIAIAASISTFFSPLSSSIYYPAINTVASDLHVSNTLINLTITVFSVTTMQDKVLTCFRLCKGSRLL